MSDKKFKYASFVTEAMTARNPKLSEPDTVGEYADGKYKTEAIAAESFRAAFQEKIQAVADEYFAGKKNVHLPWKETKEGAIAFNFKSPKKKPRLVDAKGVDLKLGIIIHSGSMIRIAGVIAAWENTAQGLDHRADGPGLEYDPYSACNCEFGRRDKRHRRDAYLGKGSLISKRP